MKGLINYWIQSYYIQSKNDGKSDRIISKELGLSERTLRRRKKLFN